MTVDVIVEDRSGGQTDADMLGLIAAGVLGALGIEEGELGVSLVTSREMQSLNEKYMDHEGPTDVLSFPLDSGESDSVGEVPLLLGDIIVCPEVAQEQAREAGHSRQAEICLLLIHGALHIAGYDHETDAGEMESLQKRFFGELCPPNDD